MVMRLWEIIKMALQKVGTILLDQLMDKSASDRILMEYERKE